MSNPSPDNAGYAGQMGLPDTTGPFNALQFLIRQALGEVFTATLVRIEAVTLPEGELDAVGTVDVLPLVNQINGAGEPTPHGTIYGVPYLRIQGGASAVIMDPAKGDIGMAVFADRDISSVKANRAPSNPGSRRRFSMSDGMYLGGFLNAVPTQFIRFAPDGGGVTLQSPGFIDLRAPAVSIGGLGGSPTALAIHGDISHDGDQVTTGEITASNFLAGMLSLLFHKHPTAATGAPSNPIP